MLPFPFKRNTVSRSLPVCSGFLAFNMGCMEHVNDLFQGFLASLSNLGRLGIECHRDAGGIENQIPFVLWLLRASVFTTLVVPARASSSLWEFCSSSKQQLIELVNDIFAETFAKMN